jgi:release factor glutamine methyltransferase
MARRNAACQGLPNLEFRHSDWYAALHGERFDLILCNPPYVDSADPALAGDGLRFEPRLALDGGPGGLRALGAVIAGAGRHLVPGGWLVVEHGGAQRSAVTSMLKLAGFTGITTLTDMAGAERASLGVWQ